MNVCIQVQFNVEIEFYIGGLISDQSSSSAFSRTTLSGENLALSSEEPLVWSIGLNVASPSAAYALGDEEGCTSITGDDGTGGCHYVDPDTVVMEYAK